MLQSVLIGVLCTGLIAIIILFVLEKKKNDQREEALKKNITESIESLRHQYEMANNELNTFLSQNIESLDNDTKEHITKIAESINSLSSETKELISTTQSDLQTMTSNSIKELAGTFDEGLKKNKAMVDNKIALLAKVIDQVIAENAELKKKLEFFTEIDEDSKNLNETEDEEAREKLIKQALAELSNPSTEETTIKPTPEPEKTVASFEKEPVPEHKPEEMVSAPKPEEAESVPEQEEIDEHAEKEKEIPSAKPLTSDAPSILDDEQKIAFTIMNKTDENLFITGKAGTGKSFLLDVFVRATSKKTIKLAPTGIAALNIGGATLHSTFGYDNLEKISLENISVSTIRLKSDKVRILKEVDTIIIDEISMVRVDTFDKIDKILRVLNKSAKPFGGKQMIVFGDLFQLPPITMWQETKYLTDYYGGIFFFNSNAYSNGRFNFIELSTNHRQKDDKAFFDILNRMREGITTKEDKDCLNERHIDRKADKSELRRILTLFPKKADAERVNREELAKIEAKEYVYKAKIVYNAKNSQKSNLYKSFPISDELRLKRGALVMMVANDPEKRWVNGTMGVIHSLSADSINVTIDGTTYEVKPCVFTEKEAIYVDGKIDYQDILRVEQYPIVLAYAITIHKSQGMTYKKIACDISNCFAPGQAYVALSRCSSLAGLNLLKLIDESLMKVDENVMKFYLSQSTEETIKRFK